MCVSNNKYGYNAEAQTVDELQYLRSRYYDAETGVFISRDSYRGEIQDLLSQKTNYNAGPSIRDTSKTPSVKTKVVMFDEGDVTTDKQTQATGALENDDPGTVSSIVT